MVAKNAICFEFDWKNAGLEFRILTAVQVYVPCFYTASSKSSKNVSSFLNATGHRLY
jgi:hypothetical protein